MTDSTAASPGSAALGAGRKALAHETRARRLVWALAIYSGVTLVLLACAAPALLSSHTPYNHFALLAEAWLALGEMDSALRTFHAELEAHLEKPHSAVPRSGERMKSDAAIDIPASTKARVR